MQTQKNAHANCVNDLKEVTQFIHKAITIAESKGATKEWWKSSEGKAERKAYVLLNRALCILQDDKKAVQPKPARNPNQLLNVYGEPVNKKGGE